MRDYLEKALSASVILAPDCVGAAVERLARASDQRIILLENLRFHKEEEANDPTFAKALAALADVYVNDAFGAAHRAHASISGITAFFRDKGVGLLMQRELDYLSRVLTEPEKPFVMILGGAKVSDKIGVIRNLLPKLSALLIGGAMAYTFLKANGLEVGKSLVENDKLQLATELMQEAAAHRAKMMLPDRSCHRRRRKEKPDDQWRSYSGWKNGPRYRPGNRPVVYRTDSQGQNGSLEWARGTF